MQNLFYLISDAPEDFAGAVVPFVAVAVALVLAVAFCGGVA
jgi:hypothetical protein